MERHRDGGVVGCIGRAATIIPTCPQQRSVVGVACLQAVHSGQEERTPGAGVLRRHRRWYAAALGSGQSQRLRTPCASGCSCGEMLGGWNCEVDFNHEGSLAVDVYMFVNIRRQRPPAAADVRAHSPHARPPLDSQAISESIRARGRARCQRAQVGRAVWAAPTFAASFTRLSALPSASKSA